jgi:hypothetical protein
MIGNHIQLRLILLMICFDASIGVVKGVFLNKLHQLEPLARIPRYNGCCVPIFKYHVLSNTHGFRICLTGMHTSIPCDMTTGICSIWLTTSAYHEVIQLNYDFEQ